MDKKQKKDKLFNTLIPAIAVLISIVGLFFTFLKELTQDRYFGILLSIVSVSFSITISIFILSLFKQKRKGNIFISYSNKDKQFVEKLINSLKIKRFNIIYDNEIVKIGDDWHEAILSGIEKSDIIIAVISDNYNASKFVSEELRFAKEYKKKILPIRINNTTKIPKGLEDVQFADFTNDYDIGIMQLLKSLISTLNQNTVLKLPQKTIIKGIEKEFKNQQYATNSILKDIEKSSILYVFAMRGGSFSNPEQPLSKCLFSSNIEQKYLISSLQNPFLKVRSEELMQDLSESINLSIKEFQEAEHKNKNIEIKLHEEVLRFRLIILSHCLYVSEVNISRQMPIVLKIDKNSSLYNIYFSFFNELWEKYPLLEIK